MKEYMARVERLRDAAVEPFICYDEFHLYFYEQWAQNAALGSMEKRYADALTHAIDHLTPVIEPEEMIVGRAAHRLSEQEQETWQTLRREIVEPMGSSVSKFSMGTCHKCFPSISHAQMEFSRLET